MQFNNIKQVTFFGLLLATSTLFIWMLGNFLFPVFWSVVFAIIFYPLYSYIEKKLNGRSSTAALLAVSGIFLMVVIPLSIISGLIIHESLGLYNEVSEGQPLNGLNLLERTASLSVHLEPLGISPEEVQTRLKGWTSDGLSTLSKSLVGFSQSTFSFLISTFVMLYLLFFMFKDGKKLVGILHHYLPMNKTHEKHLTDRFAATTRAVTKGTLVIAVVQGALGGMAFAITGVSAPTLWGVAMTFLSVIPAVGSGIIWFPAGIILLLTGSLWQGGFILFVGIVLISVIDNFLRPLLIGRDTKMPDAIILLATLGGLATFGISGFIMGPIIAAFFLSLWSIFEEKYHQELSSNT